MSRIQQIMKDFAHDSKAGQLIGGLVRSIVAYADLVRKEESMIKTAALRMDGDDFRLFVTRIEQNRHTMHEGVITNLKAANRYLFRTYGVGEVPVGGLYDFDPLHLKMNNRDAISEWALFVAPALA